MSPTRQHFSEELSIMVEELGAMGVMVENAVGLALKGILTGDKAAALTVISGDPAVNAAELALYDHCVAMIATEQPVAHDLRLIVAALSAATTLERIGDYAVNIARASVRLSERKPLDPPTHLPRMAEVVQSMLAESLRCLYARDALQAEKVARRDTEVDAAYSDISRELTARISGEPETIDQDMDYLFAAKRLERIADHLTNLCELVFYIEYGEHRELH